jgi:hypothetical protein
MADTAAHLVARVFPEAPVRQWVLTLPYTLRFRMAYDSKTVADIHRIFVQAVFASLRRRAGNNRKLKFGAVTFIQYFRHKYTIDTGLPARRYAWAELLKRVYSGKILDCLGIPSKPPPRLR